MSFLLKLKDYVVPKNPLAERMMLVIVGCTICIAFVLYSKLGLMLVFSVFNLGCIYEYTTLTNPNSSLGVIGLYARMFISFLPLLLFNLYNLGFNNIFKMYGFEYIFMSILSLSMYPYALINLYYTIVGIIWLSPAMIICISYGLEDPYKVIMMMAIVWLMDGMAFFCGRLLGKNKLAATISPNKTVEGVIGGVILSMIITYGLSYFYVIPNTTRSSFHLCFLAFLTGLIGQIGDLVESKFKRNRGIKDTSNILGNMGGFQDRCDSILFAIPVSYIYLWLVKL